jgi:hypothetical protein
LYFSSANAHSSFPQLYYQKCNDQNDYQRVNKAFEQGTQLLSTFTTESLTAQQLANSIHQGNVCIVLVDARLLIPMNADDDDCIQWLRLLKIAPTRGFQGHFILLFWSNEEGTLFKYHDPAMRHGMRFLVIPLVFYM